MDQSDTEALALVTPGPEHQEAALEYRQEHIGCGEHELHGSSLLDQIESYSDWLEHLDQTSSASTVNPDWVPASTFFAVRKSDNRIVGTIDIRHRLNEFLQLYGGHIGYGVRPSERRKGYAAEILRLGVAFSKTIGLDKVLLACYAENIASAKVIQGAGGVLDQEMLYPDGRWAQLYWIGK